MRGSSQRKSATTAETLSPRTSQVLRDMAEWLPNGELPTVIFNDAEIFALEREKVWAKSWVYLAHESEIPQRGDYVVRYIVDDPFVIVRDERGTIRALLNHCQHRGMQICRSDRGNASHFRCPYHGWTYRNNGALVGVPVQQEAYGHLLDRDQLALKQIPRLETYNGLIFGNLDQDAAPLHDWLGDMSWYLDLMLRRSPAGLEVIGSPQRWVVDVDWKIAVENFIGDSYHTLMTHRSMVELGQAPRDPRYAMYGEQVHIPGKGHGLGLIAAPPGVPMPPFWGYPEEMFERAKTSYPSPEHVEVAKRTRILHGSVFPNFSVHNPIRRPDHKYDGHVPMLLFRIWNPLGPGKVEVFTWFMVEKDASPEFKKLSSWSFLRTFGISGTFEQDDTEIWTLITRNAGTHMGRQQRANYQMGMHMEPDPNWPGPGVAYPANFTDVNLRNFYARWLELMQG